MIEVPPMDSSTDPPVGARLADRAHLRPADRRSIVRLRAAAMITHGLVHALGITLLWRWGDGNDLRYADQMGRPVPMIDGGKPIAELI